MKLLASILFISLAIFFAAGFFIAFHIEHSAIKNEQAVLINSGLNESNYVIFNFSLKEYEIVKQGDDELLIDGMMYDIVSKKESNGKIEIVCISDKKEMRLVTFLQTFYIKLPPSSNPTFPQQLISFLKTCYYENTEMDLQFFSDSCIMIHSEIFLNTSSFAVSFSPPPDLV
ncbi:MAG: hypothetical protein LH473_01385 [Chitinophagales bacterium]|nr:hypothetical protein [Chitinophagales bacterium]